MKKLHIFILKSFIGPFIYTFLLAIFLLLMQFLWKYIDDLVGKGLELTLVAKLLFYAAARFVPMALPISILLSSIMTFGNIAEKSELLAIKSAGVSLTRCMLPLFFVVSIITSLSFLFSNYYMPYANLKAGSLLYDIRKQKPALNIKEGIFYNELTGYSIKIDKKHENGVDLEGILIYDHNSEKGNDKVIIAEKGKMYLSQNETYFVIALENGHSYYEMDLHQDNKPFQRAYFKEDILRFDLSEFGMKRSSEELYRNHYAMMNNQQLENAIDSIQAKIVSKKETYTLQMTEKISVNKNLTFNSEEEHPSAVFSNQKKIYTQAISQVKFIKSLISSQQRDIKYHREISIKHEVEWHRKLTLAVACLIFFFIGAPLGAIIKKGGFGMPVIVSVGFFISYHIISVTFEKMVKEAEISTWQGMWIANAILLPIGIYLIIKANSDSPLWRLPSFRR